MSLMNHALLEKNSGKILCQKNVLLLIQEPQDEGRSPYTTRSREKVISNDFKF